LQARLPQSGGRGPDCEHLAGGTRKYRRCYVRLVLREPADASWALTLNPYPFDDASGNFPLLSCACDWQVLNADW
jgi:hypothetical protein